MANRFPLIVDSSSTAIKEIPSGDNLDLNNVGVVNAGVITATGLSVGSGIATVNATGIDVTGVVTATSFTGDGSGLTGIANTANIVSTTISNSGVITAHGGVYVGTAASIYANGNGSFSGVVTATSFVGNITGDITGNADTATALETARTIGGVSFDGTAAITLPGLNQAGDQDTTGTATNATNFTCSANNTADETVYPVFVDGATGNQGGETDSGFTYNPNSGTLTASTFSGTATEAGALSTNATGANLTLSGNLTVQGTETIINTDELNVQDKTVGIGSTNTPTSSTQDGAGIIIYGQTHINLLYDMDKAAVGLNTNLSITGITTAPHLRGTNSNFSGVCTAANFNSTSDISVKDNIQKIEDPLDKIIKIDGVTFVWKETQKPSAGVVAQNLETVLPHLVSEDEIKSVNYNGLIGYLIEAVKDQQQQIDQLKSDLESLAAFRG